MRAGIPDSRPDNPAASGLIRSSGGNPGAFARSAEEICRPASVLLT